MGLNIPDNAEPIINLIFNMLILSIIGLLSIINLCIYLIITYSITKYKIEDIKFTKYNWLNNSISKVINIYKKTTYVFIVLELILIIFCFTVLICLCYLYLSIPFN